MPAVRTFASIAFLVSAISLGLFTSVYVEHDSNRVLVLFLLPFYAVTGALQYIAPFQPNDFGRREVFTDLLNNVGAILMGAAQTALFLALASYALPNLLVKYGVVDARHTLSALPFVLQVVILFIVSDFLYYWAHRLTHTVSFLWRFHSVHHCAHRISVLNASRVHPMDLVFRRIVPMLITLQLTGASPSAVIVAGIIGSVLGTITHMNVDTDFGPINYFIGTNQVHRWHHSSVYEEAKNFGLTMAWDHLFGTYFFPLDRKRPEKFGLSDERFFPLYSYFQQLLIPFRWARLEALQREAQTSSEPIEHIARPERAAESTQASAVAQEAL